MARKTRTTDFILNRLNFGTTRDRGRNRIFAQLILVVLLSLVCKAGWAVDSTSSGVLRGVATLHSIGFEWSISGDDNHNANCQVQYRKSGETSWKTALPLYRVDYLPPSPVKGINQHFNGFAGSVLFLDLATAYQIRLTLTDPDGGTTNRTEIITTRKMPAKPDNGRRLHVVPGAGGGNGAATSPFKGIGAAQSAALAGDVFLLHAGHYQSFDSSGEIQLDRAGSIDQYIVWQVAGDGSVVFDDPVRIAADYIWLEGVHIKGHAGIDNEFGLRTYNAPKNVVIRYNKFTDFYNSIALNHGGENWVITDNTIIGDKDVIGVPDGSSSWGGEGIELQSTGGHTIGYNRISRVADGISSPLRDTDIFRNEIFDVTDDGIEPDSGYANIRVWENRISNARHNGFSFQPMNRGPWYFIRNQVAAPLESTLKIRQTSRVLLAHNVFVGWNTAVGNASPSGTRGILNFESKNNLWISINNQYAWVQLLDGILPDWRTSLDYDGFDWGSSIYAFKWGSNTRFRDLPEFQAATGLEPHAIRINRSNCFKTFQIPQAPPQSMPFQYMTLKPACNAVDAGVRLANINDQFTGNAPDLGAFELGAPLPEYGPRSGATPPPPINPPGNPSSGKSNIPPILYLLL